MVHRQKNPPNWAEWAVHASCYLQRANGTILIFMKIGCLMSLINEFIDNLLCSFQFHQNILKYTVSIGYRIIGILLAGNTEAEKFQV